MQSRIDRTMSGVHWAMKSKEPVFTAPRRAPLGEYDLAVVGAGYCGLSTALHAVKLGLSVVVLEAGAVGCGASGRNGGMAVPTFPGGITPEDVAGSIGAQRAERLAELVAGGPAFVFDLIREHDIHCDADQVGWMQPAHSPKALKKVTRVYESWRRRGVEAQWLDGGEIQDRSGAVGYLGGWYQRSGGVVNPFALASGLARVAASKGVHIHEGTAVTDVLASGASRVVKTNAGDFKARKVLFATNGYTPGVYPGLQQSVIPIRLYHCMTRPLTAQQRESVMRSRIPFTDLRKSGGFGRLDADGRLMAGGAVFVARDRSYGFKHSCLRMSQLFPQLGDVEFETYWEGWCSITDEYLPAIQQLDTSVYSAIGFSTRGVALAHTLGKEVAELLAERKTEAEMPVRVGPIKRISIQPVKQFLGGFAFPVYKARDRLGLT